MNPGFDTVIDVRSPSEFAEDHLPGAISLPVLTDAERARVGTIYTKESPFRARKTGAALVARNAARHIEGPLAEKDGGWRPLVYCWRGGQRSASFATILGQIGWRVEVLEGGYRTWRRLVVEALYDRDVPARVILLDGNTGTAKTEVLRRLGARGMQVIDLEGLANHRGSALGGFGAQPSQKAFESALAVAMERLDPLRPVLVEAESSRIGRLNLPPRLFAAMRDAPRIEITAPLGARARYLIRAYPEAAADPEAFAARLERLVALRGRAQIEQWQKAVRAGALEDVAASLIETHYDPRYAKVRARVGGQIAATARAETLDDAGIGALVDEVAGIVSGLSADNPPAGASGR